MEKSPKTLFLLPSGEFLVGTNVTCGEKTTYLENPLVVFVDKSKGVFGYRPLYVNDILEKGQRMTISIASSQIFGKIEGTINPAIIANYDKIFNL